MDSKDDIRTAAEPFQHTGHHKNERRQINIIEPWFDSMTITVYAFLSLLSYALGVRNLENVHHRAGYPKNPRKISRQHT